MKIPDPFKLPQVVFWCRPWPMAHQEIARARRLVWNGKSSMRWPDCHISSTSPCGMKGLLDKSREMLGGWMIFVSQLHHASSLYWNWSVKNCSMNQRYFELQSLWYLPQRISNDVKALLMADARDIQHDSMQHQQINGRNALVKNQKKNCQPS